MVRYGIFRGEKMVGREVFSDLKMAIKERDKWNKDFKDFNDFIKSDPVKFKDKNPIKLVEVKEYRKKRMSVEKKLREMMG